MYASCIQNYRIIQAMKLLNNMNKMYELLTHT